MKPRRINLANLIGLAGMVLGGIAALATNYAQQKQTEEMIKEEVAKAIAEQKESEEESE